MLLSQWGGDGVSTPPRPASPSAAGALAAPSGRRLETLDYRRKFRGATPQITADAMADLDLAHPPSSVNLVDIRRKYHAALRQE
jgi:hypothetical protein